MIEKCWLKCSPPLAERSKPSSSSVRFTDKRHSYSAPQCHLLFGHGTAPTCNPIVLPGKKTSDKQGYSRGPIRLQGANALVAPPLGAPMTFRESQLLLSGSQFSFLQCREKQYQKAFIPAATCQFPGADSWHLKLPSGLLSVAVWVETILFTFSLHWHLL